jgi:hypothetical protein
LAVAKTDRAIAFSARGVGAAGARLAQRWLRLLRALRGRAYAQRRRNAEAQRRLVGGPSTLYAALHRRQATTPDQLRPSELRRLSSSGENDSGGGGGGGGGGGVVSPTGAEHAFSRDNSWAEQSRDEGGGSSQGSSEDGSSTSGSVSAGPLATTTAASGSSGSGRGGGINRSGRGGSPSGSVAARSIQAALSPEARAVSLEGVLKDREVHIAMLTRQVASYVRKRRA